MKVLVVGDAMLDRYWRGECTRVSPEAPVPVVALSGDPEERLGGAANVAANIDAMGCEVAALYSASFGASPVVKLRVIARGQQVVRLDFDRPQALIPVDAVDEHSNGCAIVVVSDYGKGAMAEAAEIVARCRAHGKMVLVDPRGRDALRYAGADVLKPNLAEMRELLGGWADEHDLEVRVQQMRTHARLGAVLLTRGAAGMTLFDCEGRLDLPAEAREVYDVSGAGDTAIAALAVALAMGMPLRRAAGYANRAAGVAVTRFGTTVVKREEVFG